MHEKCIGCNRCVKSCSMLQDFEVNPKEIVLGNDENEKLSFSCNLCGLCKEVCPKDIDLGYKFYNIRNKVVMNGGHYIKLKRARNFQKWTANKLFTSKGNKQCDVVFLPGCSLSSYNGSILDKVKKYLTQTIGKTEIWIDCCGKPAKYIGDKDLFNKTFNKYIKGIKETGAKRIITACGNCYNMLKEQSEIEAELLWDVLAECGLPDEVIGLYENIDTEFIIHDPCSMRYEIETHRNIRSLLDKLKVKHVEFEYNKEKTKCCGAGGMVGLINEEVAHKNMRNRVQESQGRNIICYCQSCAEALSFGGGQAINIIDLIFNYENIRYKFSQDTMNSVKRWKNRFLNKNI
ncbi:(Fe-S)-binding protein [Oceanirhabdus sp. W0125-5]|uniref:(Fe-S)-binding protein n=1 Tax=Oceanirhabdus sp. W0125-5 TaxID=2999116 RepID=UPI0022F336C1|nr:(Fe-S)-binding protein [Oceanirhabdus sp. W0125-5]WBW99676.1 (Fe-S)-binding protein [Oceanirhabdus sp. W0125-5]